MNYRKITKAFDTTSKVCAVAAAPAIVLSTAATVVLFPLTVFFSLVAGNLREKFNLIVRNPVTLTFLLFYALFLIGVTYSTAPWSDILVALRKYDKFLFAVMFLPLFVEEKWRNYAINAFLVAILVLLIASYLRGFGLLHYGATGTAGVFKKSIEFNFLLAFGGYLSLFKFISTSRCRWAWLIFFALIAHTVLFRSMGRSGYAIFAALITMFFLQRFHWKGLLIAAIGVALLFSSAYIFAPTFKNRINYAIKDIRTYNQNDNTSVGFRITFVKNSLKLIKSHPIIGTGTGSYAKEYKNIESRYPGFTRNPHNEYMHIMVQFGFVGLIILLMLFGVPLWHARFLPEQSKYIVYGVVLSIMLGSLANSWLLDVTQGHFYAYFIALAFASLPKNKYSLSYGRSDK